jgi:PAS domain S-box-containing protein
MKSSRANDTASSLAFLGSGDVGARIRVQEWSASLLGHPAGWPQALKSVVGLILNTKFPMFVAWGPELAFLYNDSYAEILGEKHPAALGRPFQEVWCEIWDDVGPIARRALQGEATFEENLPLRMFRRGYEELTWFTFSYSPVRDEDGTIAGVYCACTETTGQVQAEKYREEENQRLMTLFEQAPSFIAVLMGPEHRFELSNKAYQQLVGHRQIVGKCVREALPEVNGQGFVKLLDQVYATGEPFVGTAMPIMLQRTPDGPLERRFVDFVYQPIRDASDAITGIFAEGSDVTERKLAEDELRTANRQKDQFLAMLAHELRNPLAPIATAAQLLKLKRLDEKGIQNVSEIIARQAEHMTGLVNDLLDVSRVTRGVVLLEKEALDLNVVLANAVEQVRPLIEARRHRLNVHLTGESSDVTGDRIRLVQVFSNLLNNAAKYTQPGGDLDLTVRRAGREVEVSVRDNGCGIPAEVLPYVFDLFTQAERTPDRSQGGLGIGLALVKSLVALHGGSVEARSGGNDQGSEFLIRLPAMAAGQPGSAGLPAGAGKAGAAARSLRILIVDDNADAALTLAMLLEVAGHQVKVEHDSLLALARAEQDPPQVCLLDIGLPGMDGYKLAARLRSLPGMHGALIVALSGYGKDEDVEQSKSAGFDYHLVKPAEMARLTDILASAGAGPARA